MISARQASRIRPPLTAGAFLLCFAAPAWAAGSDVVGINLLWLALILMSARLFALG